MQRPTGVTIVAVLNFLAAAALAIFSVPFFAGHSIMTRDAETARSARVLVGMEAFVGAGLLVLAVLSAVIGIGLLKLRNWARILALIWFLLGLLTSVAGVFASVAPLRLLPLLREFLVVAIDVWILWYLLRPQVRQAFAA